MFTIKLQTLQEAIPKHNQMIYYIDYDNSSGQIGGLNLWLDTFQYVWVEVDSKGNKTNSTIFYNEGDVDDDDRYELQYRIGDMELNSRSKDILWISQEDLEPMEEFMYRNRGIK